MERRNLAAELVLAAAGGFIGTKLMERLSMALYAQESEATRRGRRLSGPGRPSGSPRRRACALRASPLLPR